MSNLPVPTLCIPPHIQYLILLGRCRSRLDRLLHFQMLPNRTSYRILKTYDPDEVMAFRDRAEHVHLVIQEFLDDPIYYREQVGRIKLYFRYHQIIQQTS